MLTILFTDYGELIKLKSTKRNKGESFLHFEPHSGALVYHFNDIATKHLYRMQ